METLAQQATLLVAAPDATDTIDDDTNDDATDTAADDALTTRTTSSDDRANKLALAHAAAQAENASLRQQIEILQQLLERKGDATSAAPAVAPTTPTKAALAKAPVPTSAGSPAPVSSPMRPTDRAEIRTLTRLSRVHEHRIQELSAAVRHRQRRLVAHRCVCS